MCVCVCICNLKIYIYICSAKTKFKEKNKKLLYVTKHHFAKREARYFRTHDYFGWNKKYYIKFILFIHLEVAANEYNLWQLLLDIQQI